MPDLITREYACTVVSLLPMELNEEKPHLLPSVFHIDAAENGEFNILHVKEGIHYVANPLIDEGKPGSTFKQITTPDEMARSICDDFKSACICVTADSEPGLFWVQGKLEKIDVKAQYSDRLSLYKERQLNWFRRLVAMADADWQKNHNKMAVSDLQRKAAKALGLQEDWVEIRVTETKPCPFCTIAVPPEAIKCPNCHEIVNIEAYQRVIAAQKEIVNV